MKKVLLVNGSSRPQSSNYALLKYLSGLSPDHSFQFSIDLSKLPLFVADNVFNNDNVALWKKQLSNCDSVIISSPEYIQNIPAVLKNALEWVTESGEFHEKTIVPIIYTPHKPRGEWALNSLLGSLSALNCTVKAQIILHHNEIRFDKDQVFSTQEANSILKELLNLI